MFNLFKKKEKDNKKGFYYVADKQYNQYLDMCKKDIRDNLVTSMGGIYVGSIPNKENIVAIGYGETKYIRMGFNAILKQPIFKQIIEEEMEKIAKEEK